MARHPVAAAGAHWIWHCRVHYAIEGLVGVIVCGSMFTMIGAGIRSLGALLEVLWRC